MAYAFMPSDGGAYILETGHPYMPARHSIRRAADMPEARSRRLRYLAQGGAQGWWQAVNSDAVVFMEIDAAGNDLIATNYAQEKIDHLAGELRELRYNVWVPAHARRDTPQETGRALDEWQTMVTRGADLYYVSDELTAMATAAGGALPVAPLPVDTAPSRMGLLCWGKEVVPWPALGGAGHPNETALVGVHGVLWQIVHRGVWLTVLLDGPQTGDGNWLIEANSLLIPLGGACEWGEIPGPIGVVVRTMLATWLIMGQTITESAPVHPEKKAAKKLARREHPLNPVRYVSLRQVTRVGEDREQSATRTYEHRWVVSGFWRNQYYPSTNEHRPIWINPYIKGPKGAPLLHSERVFTLRR